ncbi:MAG: hypothetical protein KJZ80_19415 [Hyphomicrobiaceae bacterium]|nr:hypothetical protein [Hyphomicrobiaceae bacterium]
MRSLLFVVACVWIAGVAYAAGVSWPVFPLDMPAGDPQVRAAYDSAVWAHVVRYGLIALVPAAALIGIGWSVSRRKRIAP